MTTRPNISAQMFKIILKDRDKQFFIRAKRQHHKQQVHQQQYSKPQPHDPNEMPQQLQQQHSSQHSQKKYHNRVQCFEHFQFYEWIPYNRFTDIKEIAKAGFIMPIGLMDSLDRFVIKKVITEITTLYQQKIQYIVDQTPEDQDPV
ncbi:hypothetical protein Glove_21g183 [Diversispora epigaea]|uniref:Uncharacterized protein n=1 Tax=Diversispora epigaea TaxID=1348612 RepID=A0A397JRR5_9GLOM|nr:hypothetical protein Glove_21g183 [Diversispora epigaea]